MNTEEVLIKMGQQIKRIRKEQQLSQMQLAEKCNFEKASMSRIESGQSNVTISTLEKISKALSVPIADFFK